MNNVFDAYWKEEVEDSVSGCTVEPVLKITCEGRHLAKGCHLA